jgi:hypothetical protein
MPWPPQTEWNGSSASLSDRLERIAIQTFSNCFVNIDMLLYEEKTVASFAGVAEQL